MSDIIRGIYKLFTRDSESDLTSDPVNGIQQRELAYNRSRQWLSFLDTDDTLKRFGIVFHYDSRSFTSFANAITTLGSENCTLVVAQQEAIATNVTVPSNIHVMVVGAGSFDISTGNTLTINGQLTAPYRKIFFGDGTAVLGATANDQYIQQWWGGDRDSFIQIGQTKVSNSRYYSIGIDESDSNKLKVSYGATGAAPGTNDYLSISISGAVHVYNNQTIGGTLGVTGATSLSTLSTSGLSTLNSLSVTTTALVGGTLGVTGLITATGGILPGLGSDGAGRIFQSSVNGLKLRGVTGSSNDFVISSEANTVVFRIPTGTSTVDFPVATTMSSTLGVTGTSTLATVNASGNITIANGGTPAFILNATSVNNRLISFQTNGTARWAWIVDNTAESGSDTGSKIFLRAFTDAGTTIDSPIDIVRVSGGAMTLSRPITSSAGIALTGGAGGVGTLAKSSTQGLQLVGVTGSSNDFVIRSAANTTVMRVPTGTSTVDFPVATTMSSTLDVSGQVTGTRTSGNLTPTFLASSTGPRYGFFRTDAATDQKYWEWSAGTNELVLRTRADDGTAGTTIFDIDRSANVATLVTISPAVSLSSTLDVSGQQTNAGNIRFSSTDPEINKSNNTGRVIITSGTGNNGALGAVLRLEGADYGGVGSGGNAALTAPSTSKLFTISMAISVAGNSTLSGAVSCTSTVDFANRTKWVTNASGDVGAIWKSSGSGLVMEGVTGSSYDLAFLNPSAQPLLRNPTGTQTMEFAGAVIGQSTLTVNGTGNHIFSGSTAGSTNHIQVSHSDNTSGSSHARMTVQTAGSSSGDPYLSYIITGQATVRNGLDNSDSDSLVWSTGADLGTTNIMRLTLTGGLGLTSTSACMAIGQNSSSDVGLYISESLTGLTSSDQKGLISRATFSSSATAGTAGYFQVRTAAASFTISNGYGVRIPDAVKGSGSTITNLYGLKIEDQTAGSTNYALYTGSGLVRFGGATTFESNIIQNSGYCSLNGDDNQATLFEVKQSTNAYIHVNNTNSSEVITFGNATTNPIVRILGGSGATAGLRLQTNETNSTNKEGRVKAAHYTNSEEPATMIWMSCTSTNNALFIGGASSAENAATAIDFYTASNNTTTLGSRRGGFDSSGTLDIVGKTQHSDIVGIGAAASSDSLLYVTGTPSSFSGVTKYGIQNTPTYPTGTTGSAFGIYSKITTAAASFTVTNAFGLYVGTPSIGAGSAVTTIVGLGIQDQTGGGTNYAIYTGLGTVRLGGALTLDGGMNTVSGGWYDSGTYTATATGMSSSTTGTARWTKVGNHVTLYIPQLTNTSNSTSLTITGMPSAIRPARTQIIYGMPIRDNSTSYALGVAQIATDGTMTLGFSSTVTSGYNFTFTNSGGKGWDSVCTITYALD